MLLINLIFAEGAEVNIAAKKDRNKTAAAAEENNYSITVEKNSKNNNKTGVAVSADFELTDLTEL